MWKAGSSGGAIYILIAPLNTAESSARLKAELSLIDKGATSKTS